AALGAFEAARALITFLVQPLPRGELVRVAVAVQAARHEMVALRALELLFLRLGVARLHALLRGRELPRRRAGDGEHERSSDDGGVGEQPASASLGEQRIQQTRDPRSGA